MTNFIQDNTTAPAFKTDLVAPGSPLNKYNDAANYNVSVQALIDTRSWLRTSGTGSPMVFNMRLGTPSSAGCKGDGATDDTAAINAIYAYGMSLFTPGFGALPPVFYYPTGWYVTTGVTGYQDKSAVIVGDGPGSVIIGPTTFMGHIGLYASPSHLPLVGNFLVTAPVSGPGYAAKFPAGSAMSMHLSDAVPGLSALMGASAFCTRFWFRPDATPTGNQVDMLGLGTDYPAKYPFWFMYSGGQYQLYRFQTTAGSSSPINLGSLSNGTWYHVAFDWDGTTVRVWVGGVLAGSQALGGTLVSNQFDEFHIGARCNTAQIQSTSGQATPAFSIYSVECAAFSRYVTAFTPPTTAHVADSHTIFLCNFDASYNDVIQVQAPQDYGGRADCRLQAWTAAVGALSVTLDIQGVQFAYCSTAIAVTEGVFTGRNLNLAANIALYLEEANTGYVRDFTFSGFGRRPRYGFYSTLETNNFYLDGFTIRGFDFNMGISGGNETRARNFYLVGGYAQLVYNIADGATFENGLFSFEGQGGTHLCNVVHANIGAGSAAFRSCSFGSEMAGISMGAFATIGGCSLSFSDCYFYGHGDVTYAINDFVPGNIGYGVRMKFDNCFNVGGDYGGAPFSGGKWYTPLPAGAVVLDIFRGEDGATFSSGMVDVMDSTDSSGTPGAATINKAAGRSAIAIGASSVVITNSLAKAGQRVRVFPESIDAGSATGFKGVATNGFVTVTISPGTAVAAWKFSWELGG